MKFQVAPYPPNTCYCPNLIFNNLEKWEVVCNCGLFSNILMMDYVKKLYYLVLFQNFSFFQSLHPPIYIS